MFRSVTRPWADWIVPDQKSGQSKMRIKIVPDQMSGQSNMRIKIVPDQKSGQTNYENQLPNVTNCHQVQLFNSQKRFLQNKARFL